MAASISDTLAQLCTPDAKVRDTYFSETYRRKFKLNEQSGMWDITHIQIPFAPERERSLMQRFGIQSEEELIEFYRRLPLHIANERTMLQSIAKVESEKRVGDNFVSYILQKSRKLQDGPEWGREYFFVSEPMDAVISGKTSVTLLELVLLATRFTQSIKLLHETGLGIHIGAWDLDTIYVIQGEEGFNRIVNGSLLYGEMESQDSIPLLVSTPGTACADVWKGNRQSIDTDLFAIASILWAVSNGDHWTDEPDFAEAPRYAPDGLVETLVLCRDGGGETALKNVHTRLHELANEIKRRPEMNIEIPLGSKKLGVRPRFLIEANSYDLVKSESAGLGTEENHPGPQAEPAENTPDAEMPNPSDQGQAHEAELPENVVGGGEEKSEDPLVEGFEMVSANFDIMPCEDGTDAPPADRADTSETSDFEFLDIPFDIPPEPPQKRVDRRHLRKRRSPLKQTDGCAP